MKKAFLVLVLLVWSCGPPQPVPTSSPRLNSPSNSPTAADPCHASTVVYCAVNSQVTSATIKSTICTTGWTTTIRPPQSVTAPYKAKLVGSGNPADFQLDHRLPLEGGGSPGFVLVAGKWVLTAPENLSLEPISTAHSKDQAENLLKSKICSGEDLLVAQTQFISEWLGPVPAYKK